MIANVETQVLSALAMNTMKGNIKVNVVDAPPYGVNKKDTLEDLGLLTGATVINEELGDDMDLIKPEHLGKAVKVTTTRTETVIQVENIPETVVNLNKSLQKNIENTKKPK